MEQQFGVFRGTILRQSSGTIGDSKSVFANFKGIKNELVYPQTGGMIQNPPKGEGFKFFAGDLMEYRTDEKFENPKIYLLKTYLVEGVDSQKVYIIRDKYKHIPYVGDVLGVAPATIGGSITNSLTVTAVVSTTHNSKNVWELTVTGTVDATADNILVEVDTEGKMLVQKINAFADCDMDMPYVGANTQQATTDFDNAKYLYTPAVGGAFIKICKMSPVPECVLANNLSPFDGLFRPTNI